MRSIPRQWRLAAAITMMAILGAATGAVQAQGMSVRMLRVAHYTQLMMAARDAKDWNQAARYMGLVAKLDPIQFNSQYNLACLLALNGQTDEALDALELAIRYGWEDSDWMKSDTDLDSLRKLERFSELLQAADAAREEKVVIFVPKKLTGSAPAPLVVALHGFSGNPREFAAYWSEAAEDLGVVIAAPKGVLRLGDGGQGYAWSEPSSANRLDVAGTAKVVDEAIAAASRARKIDPEQVILAGHSQGAAATMALLAADPDKFVGGITMAALFGNDVSQQWRDMPEDSSIRVCLIVGNSDPVRKHSHDARDVIKGLGHDVKFVTIPATGHEIPVDYRQRLADGIRFVLNR